MLILIPLKLPYVSKPKPAWRAASIPANTSVTGKSTSFMLRNTASSKPSKLTVTRCKPAALSAIAFLASKDPFVVNVKSNFFPPCVRNAANCSINTSRFFRSNGSPPVSLILRTPCDMKTRAKRVISSNVNSDECGKYGWFLSKTSLGMQ